MKKRLVLIFILSAANALAAADAYLINNLAETLTRINLETGAVQNHVTILGDTPNQVSFHNGYLYVLNSISANLQKINPANFQIVDDIPLPIGSNPYSMLLEGDYAYISGLVSGLIYKVNLASSQVVDDIEVGSYPEGLEISNGLLYVAQTAFNPVDFTYGQGKVAMVDPETMELNGWIDVGKNPQSFVKIADTLLHAVCTGNYNDVAGSIFIINTVTNLVIDSIMIGGQPVSGALDRSGIVYLAAGGWVDDGFIYTYNSLTGQILRGPSNPILAGLGVASVAIDSLGLIYSCNFGEDTVAKFNQAGQIIANYGVGDGPQSIVIIDDRVTGVPENDPQRPGRPFILGNYPNPFNSSTVIKINLMGTSEAELRIFDIQGRFIIAIEIVPGSETVIWEGVDYKRHKCSSGIYFATLAEPNSSGLGASKEGGIKMIFVR